MKTPMQELIEQLKEERDLHGYERGLHYETAIELAESMLEKEKEMMCGIYDDAVSEFDPTYIGQEKYGEHYYNETFNNKWNEDTNTRID